MKTQAENHTAHFWTNYGLLGLTIVAALTFFTVKVNNLINTSYYSYPFAIPSAKAFASTPKFSEPNHLNAVVLAKEEADPSLAVENWMTTLDNWATEDDAQLNPEAWMSNLNLWTLEDATEPALEIEEWMSNPDAWQLEDTETALTVEPWMSNTQNWAVGQGSMCTTNDSLPRQAKLN